MLANAIPLFEVPTNAGSLLSADLCCLILSVLSSSADQCCPFLFSADLCCPILLSAYYTCRAAFTAQYQPTLRWPRLPLLLRAD
jgi:hypothetical protein